MTAGAGQIHFASAICLSILSVTTVTSNLLLLVAIWKDPMKCFRAPTTGFIVGISLADLVTALTTEPFFAANYYTAYFSGMDSVGEALQMLFKAGSIISTVAISYSFLILLALSWSQYIAIKCPRNFKRIVTRRNTIICNFLSLLYLLSFTALQFTGINEYLFLKVNLAVNSSFLSVNLVVILVLLNSAFRRHINHGRSLPAREIPSKQISGERRSTRQDNIEHQFTAVAIYLAAILLLAALPHVITAQMYLYSSSLSPKATENFRIALEISDLLLFLKVCMDTFVYAWRLPSYRQTVKILFLRLRCCGQQRENNYIACYSLTPQIESNALADEKFRVRGDETKLQDTMSF